jgi:F-type H+-transporting ATPase subunit delta
VQGASRNSLARLHEKLPDDADQGELSDQLFAMVTLLTRQATLRRALSDPSGAKRAKTRIVTQLLGEQLGDAAIGVVKEAVGLRWSQSRDLVDAIEELAVDARLGIAENDGSLDEVEDELFRFERILDREPELRSALTDRNLPSDRKRDLLRRLLEGKTTEVTLALLERAVLEPRGRTLERAIDDLTSLAASRRDRLIAHVTSAVELTDDEQRDLTEALATAFGHQVRLQVVVDEDLIGGLTVRVGDELIDGSVARHLDDARRKLTGRSATERH